jgi:hypothetical protein
MCIGARKRDTSGNPDPKYIGASCAETSEPHDADAHAPLHAAGKRLLKEDRKPRARRRAAFDVLQFCLASSNTESQPGNGRWRDGSPLENGRCCRYARCVEAKTKRHARPVFERCEWKVVGGFSVRATLPNSVTGFATEGPWDVRAAPPQLNPTDYPLLVVSSFE